MHNRLKPTNQSIKGIGFGRALPAAFGFGKGISPDGINNYISVPSMVGQMMPAEFAVEFWVRKISSKKFSCYYIETGAGMAATYGVDTQFEIIPSSWNIASGVRGLGPKARPATQVGEVLHVVINMSNTRKGKIYFNGGIPNGGTEFETPVIHSYPSGMAILRFNILNGAYVYNSPNYYTEQVFDEWRYYERWVTLSEIISNNNLGIGENPQNTIGLKVWFNFQELEDLATGLVGGHPVNLREVSQNGNYGIVHNAIADPANSNFILKPFIL